MAQAGPPPGGEPPRHRPGPSPPGQPAEDPIIFDQLPPSEQKRIRKFLKKSMPELYLRLEELERVNPERARARLSRHLPRILEVMRRSQDNPQIAHLMIQQERINVQIRKHAQRYEQCRTDEERRQVARELKSKISERFDLHHEQMGLEIEALAKRLEAQRKKHERQAKHKERLIISELQTLIGDVFEGES